MDIAKQIIDQRVYKILADNPDLFSADDAEHKRSKAFYYWEWPLIWI